MKRIINLLLIALAVVSCKGVNNKEVNAITFDTIVVQEKIKLFPDKPDSIPYATLNIKFVYPTTFGTKEELQKLQALFYNKVFGEEYTDATSPQDAVKRYIGAYTEYYRKELAQNYVEQFPTLDLTDEGDRFFLTTFNYEQEIKNQIEFQNNSFLSFTLVNYDYKGGAHGINTKKNINISLTTYNQLEVRSLLAENYEVALAEIIKAKLLEIKRRQLQADGYSELSDAEFKEQFYDFDAIAPNNNILFTESGITVTYNPYEISGLVDMEYFYNVKIPYGEIAHLLNTEMLEKLLPNLNLKEADKLKTEKEARCVNYNDFPIAYVKNSKIHFFNPENETIAEFTEETDSVFNCVYSDKDAMFYYTVSRNGKLSIKQMDLSDTSAQPKLLFDLNKPTSEFFSETYGEKAKLKFIKDNLLLNCDFSWESYSFTKFYDYSIRNKTVTKIDWEQFESRYGPFPYSFENSLENYKSVYNKAKRLNLKKEDYADDDFEIEYILESVSADDSKIAFSILLGFGDLPHGPYCVANTDGTNMQVLEGTDMGSSFKPLWCNNNAVFERTIDAEEGISEFCYTLAADNTVVRIDQDVNYYTVRTKRPIK